MSFFKYTTVERENPVERSIVHGIVQWVSTLIISVVPNHVGHYLNTFCVGFAKSLANGLG